MRKQELVHLHGLCVLVRDHVESRADAPDDAFARYDDLDVSPTAIYRGKSAHRRAVLRLAADTAGVVDDESATAGRPVADGQNAGEFE